MTSRNIIYKLGNVKCDIPGDNNIMCEPKSVLMIQTGGKHFKTNLKFYFLLMQLNRQKLKLILFRDVLQSIEYIYTEQGTCHVYSRVSEMNEGVQGLSNP